MAELLIEQSACRPEWGAAYQVLPRNAKCFYIDCISKRSVVTLSHESLSRENSKVMLGREPSFKIILKYNVVLLLD